MTLKICSVLLLSLLLTIPFSHAQNTQEISLAEASEKVRLDTKGRILSAKTSNSNGRETHKIQVLTPSGRVKTIRMPMNNASNGNKNNRQSRRTPPSNQRPQHNSTETDYRRNKHRDRSMHNSRLGAPQQTTNPRSRTKNNRSATRENTGKK